jgi:hypothetical protein
MTGTIKSVTAGEMMLATASGDVDVALTLAGPISWDDGHLPKTRVLERQAASISDIRPGTYLGVLNQNTAGDANSGVAIQVIILPFANSRNYSPQNNSQMKTNGRVKMVTSTSAGKAVDIDLGQTVRHVLVKSDTPITRMADVGIGALKPGVQVSLENAEGTDGRLTAVNIVIGLDPAPAGPSK